VLIARIATAEPACLQPELALDLLALSW